MNTLTLTALVWLSSLGAGFLGALTGLGGGVVIIPVLTLVFGVDIRYAIGAALVSVIATSCGAAAAYVKEGYTNIRIGMFLEIATTTGALAGASAAARLPTHVIAVIFGAVLMVSAYLAGRPRRRDGKGDSPIFAGTKIGTVPRRPQRREDAEGDSPISADTRIGTVPRQTDWLAARLRLDGSYPRADGPVSYHVGGVAPGFGLMFVAGTLSGLLGIGSGALKVLAMDQVMRIPLKVSTTTSNFMIGVTAAASAGVYLNRGYIDPGLAMPVVLGVLPGALLGARVLGKTRTRTLRTVFAVALALLALEMIYNGLTGRL